MELKRFDVQRWLKQIGLLIVPYGIETRNHVHIFAMRHAFNRTLWN